MNILSRLVNDILQNNAHHYTVARIAKKCGLAQSTVKKIQSGTTKQPHYNTALSLFSLYFSIQYDAEQVKKLRQF